MFSQIVNVEMTIQNELPRIRQALEAILKELQALRADDAGPVGEVALLLDATDERVVS